jgi:hopanoid biosynthesis associated protein HpnK
MSGSGRRYFPAARSSAVKRLIVNADDLGLSENVDLGIVRAHTGGIVTSATLLACGGSAEHAASLAHANPGLGVGVHLCLTREYPVSDPASIKSITSSGRFFGGPGRLMARLIFGAADKREIYAEFTAQVKRAISLGIKPTHLDGHQHIHIMPGIFHITVSVAKEFGIWAVRFPVGPRTAATGPHGFGAWAEKAALETLAKTQRPYMRRMGIVSPDGFYGLAETGRLSSDTVAVIVRGLPDGTSELMCHPGHRDDEAAASTGWGYGWEDELRAVTDPSLRGILEAHGVELVNYTAL